MVDIYNPPTFDRPIIAEAPSDESLRPQGEFSKANERAEKFNVATLTTKKKRLEKENLSDFDSTKFSKVRTLLTNVEEYSHRIREEVDHYAHRVREDVELLKSEYELELAQALIIKKEAHDNAKKLLQEAKDSREGVIAEAKKEGFDAGFEDGNEQFKEENERCTNGILQLLKGLNTLRKDVLSEHEKQIIQLSILIAKKVVHQQITTDNTLVLNVVKDTLARFEGKGNIKIAVNPIEFDFLSAHQAEFSEFLEDDQDVKLRKDPQVEPASALIESSFTAVDLNLKSQFAEVESQLKNCADERRQVFLSD